MDSFNVGDVPASITFGVGPDRYKPVFVRDLRDLDGTPVWGLCDPNTLTIFLDADHRDRNLEDTLRHELSHAWDFAVGEPRDAEAVAQRLSTVMRQLGADLAAQGGMAALHRERRRFAASARVVCRVPGEHVVVAADDVEQQDGVAPSSAGRAACGTCGKIVAGGAIVDGPHRYDRAVGGVVVRRTLYCGHCSHLQSWDEGVYLGAPNQAVARGPFFVTGPEVYEFLHQNPRASGLAVAVARR